MKTSKKWLILICAGLIAGAACGKKKDDSSSAAPAAGSGGSVPTPATPAPTPSLNASLKENPDGTASLDLILPDANGANTSHKGQIDRTRETELRSEDGKSLAAVRSLEGFGILVAVQYQIDRSEGRLYILAKNQNTGYEPLLAGVPSERNGGLNKAISVIDEVRQACKFSVTQSVASMAQYFRANATATLDQYAQFKQKEVKETQNCTEADLSTGPDGKAQITWGAPRNPTPHQQGLPNEQTPPEKKAPAPTRPEPIAEQMPDLPLPPPNRHGQAPAPQPIPPTAEQQRQEPTPAPVFVTDSKGYHQNWQACYDSGKWRTDGNIYCKQKWWQNCSPETGGKVCKIKGENEERHEKRDEPSSPSRTSSEERKGEWTQDFSICYSAGKWQTDGNRYCKKDFWPNCSPDSGANRCRPVYGD